MYDVVFYGRKAGAPGLTYHQRITVRRGDLPDDFEQLPPDAQLEAIRLAVYDRGFEHISGIAIIPCPLLRDLVARLNDIIVRKPREWVEAVLSHRVLANQRLVEHPAFFCKEHGDAYEIGILGVLGHVVRDYMPKGSKVSALCAYYDVDSEGHKYFAWFSATGEDPVFEPEVYVDPQQLREATRNTWSAMIKEDHEAFFHLTSSPLVQEFMQILLGTDDAVPTAWLDTLVQEAKNEVKKHKAPEEVR